jgi:hypothetical protein
VEPGLTAKWREAFGAGAALTQIAQTVFRAQLVAEGAREVVLEAAAARLTIRTRRVEQGVATGARLPARVLTAAGWRGLNRTTPKITKELKNFTGKNLYESVLRIRDPVLFIPWIRDPE